MQICPKSTNLGFNLKLHLLDRFGLKGELVKISWHCQQVLSGKILKFRVWFAARDTRKDALSGLGSEESYKLRMARFLFCFYCIKTFHLASEVA